MSDLDAIVREACPSEMHRDQVMPCPHCACQHLTEDCRCEQIRAALEQALHDARAAEDIACGLIRAEMERNDKLEAEIERLRAELEGWQRGRRTP